MLRSFLRRLRAEHGRITQAEAAARVGVSRETWVKWESRRGGRLLNPDSARRIEAEFGLADGEMARFENPRRAEDGDLERRVAELEDELVRLADELRHLREERPASEGPPRFLQR